MHRFCRKAVSVAWSHSWCAILLVFVGCCTHSAQLSPAPTKIGIRELLKNKGEWNGKRVEVEGFYFIDFELSVMSERREDAVEDGLWIDRFRLAPKQNDNVRRFENGYVRAVGTFEFREGYRAGHMGACEASLTQIEVFEHIRVAH